MRDAISMLTVLARDEPEVDAICRDCPSRLCSSLVFDPPDMDLALVFGWEMSQEQGCALRIPMFFHVKKNGWNFASKSSRWLFSEIVFLFISMSAEKTATSASASGSKTVNSAVSMNTEVKDAWVRDMLGTHPTLDWVPVRDSLRPLRLDRDLHHRRHQDQPALNRRIIFAGSGGLLQASWQRQNACFRAVDICSNDVSNPLHGRVAKSTKVCSIERWWR